MTRYPKRYSRRQRKALRARDIARHRRIQHEARVQWLADAFDAATRGIQAYARAVGEFGRAVALASADFAAASRMATTRLPPQECITLEITGVLE